MAAILLTLIAALCACIIFSRKLHETIPPAVFTATLSVYLFALILPLNYAIFITTGIALILFILALIMTRVSANWFPQKTWSALLLDEVSHESSNATCVKPERKRLFANNQIGARRIIYSILL